MMSFYFSVQCIWCEILCIQDLGNRRYMDKVVSVVVVEHSRIQS